MTTPSLRRRYGGKPALSLCLSFSLLTLPLTTLADDGSPPICTDRPTKANSTCTVPTGSFQLETDVANTAHDRQGTSTTDTVNIINPTLKYGLGAQTDVQINWSPHIRVETRDRQTGERDRTNGSGDVIVRLKTRLVDTDTGALALIPFVKAPTAAHGLGNDRWEGGLAMPIAIPLPGDFSLTLGPEVDVLADADGAGHHGALINLVNVAHPLGSKMTVAFELWDSVNRDPSGTIRQRSADIALSYLVGPALQLDIGANIGLNRDTPDRQVYLGLSTRF